MSTFIKTRNYCKNKKKGCDKKKEAQDVGGNFFFGSAKVAVAVAGAFVIAPYRLPPSGLFVSNTSKINIFNPPRSTLRATVVAQRGTQWLDLTVLLLAQRLAQRPGM
jgi:hypothetical protein